MRGKWGWRGAVANANLAPAARENNNVSLRVMFSQTFSGIS
jgi:hypothetical protein